jgi:hypothetical protein
MSALSTVEVSAIVSAVVTTSFNTVIRYGEQLVEFVKTRLPDDHTALYAGTLRLGVDAQTDSLAVQVSSAPSRRLKRAGLDIDQATAVVRSRFGEWFPEKPERSGPDIGVSYTVMKEEDSYTVDRRIWLYPSGRVDLYWCLPASLPDDPVPIDLAEFLRPLLMLAALVGSSDYYRVYARRPLRFKHRFDWSFVAAMHIYDRQRAARNWILRFPGPQPRRAADRQAFCPSAGYAADELRGWPMGRPVEELVRVALRSVLFHNGYHDVEDALTNAVCHIGAPPADHSAKIMIAEVTGADT